MGTDVAVRRTALRAGTDRGVQEFVAPAEKAVARGEAHRGRPVWLVALLAASGLGGLYWFVWLGMTWAEMTRELDDDGGHPWWHAIAIMLVPIYSLFRFYAHYDRIRCLVDLHQVDAVVRPRLALLAWVAAGAPAGVYAIVAGANGNADVATALGWLGSAVGALVIAHGQAGINAYWRAVSPGAETRVRWGEWVLLAAGLLITGLQVVGLLA